MEWSVGLSVCTRWAPQFGEPLAYTSRAVELP